MTSAGEFRIRAGPLLMGLAATVLILMLMGKVADLLLVLFVAIIFSLYLTAVTDALTRRLRIPRRLAFAATLLLTFGAIYTLFALLVPPVVDQTRQLIGRLPSYVETWQAGLLRMTARYPALRDAVPDTGELVAALVQQLEGGMGRVVPGVFAVGHQIVIVFSILVMGIYMTLYPALYREWLIALLPPVHRDLARDTMREIGTTLRAWIVGQLLAMAILAFLTAIGLYVLGVPYWLTFGVFTGAVAIVPFFGTLISTILPALFVLGGPGFGGFGPGTHALFVVALGYVIHVIEGNVVIPLITSKQVEIPPVLSMMAILIVGRLMGFFGIIVAVPLLAVLMVLVRRILIHRVYEGQDFRHSVRDKVLVLRVPGPDGGVMWHGSPPFDVLYDATSSAPVPAGTPGRAAS